jgi:hypothetical protein
LASCYCSRLLILLLAISTSIFDSSRKKPSPQISAQAYNVMPVHGPSVHTACMYACSPSSHWAAANFNSRGLRYLIVTALVVLRCADVRELWYTSAAVNMGTMGCAKDHLNVRARSLTASCCNTNEKVTGLSTSSAACASRDGAESPLMPA